MINACRLENRCQPTSRWHAHRHHNRTHFSLSGLIAAAGMVLLASCGGAPSQRDSLAAGKICPPLFLPPSKTTIGIEQLSIPEPNASTVQVANLGEDVVRRGAFSRVTTATLVGSAPLRFLPPRQLGSISRAGRPELASWAEGSINRQEIRALSSQTDCGGTDLGDEGSTLLTATAHYKLMRAVIGLPENDPVLLTTRPLSGARGNLITTEAGTLISGLTGRFTPVQKETTGLRRGTADSSVQPEGIFLPANSDLPQLLLLQMADKRVLVPVAGEITLRDKVVRLVQRQSSGNVIEQSLKYMGRQGKVLSFLFKERQPGPGTGAASTLVSHDLRSGNTLTVGASQVEIVEASPTQLRYRVLAAL